MEFVKLADLKEVTIHSVGTPVWKKWLPAEKKFETSISPRKRVDGFTKYYPAQTNKGKLDLTSPQLSSMLEACYAVKEVGISDIRGATFEVVAIPKEIEIRGEKKTVHNYYFNFKGYVQEAFQVEVPNDDFEDEIAF